MEARYNWEFGTLGKKRVFWSIYIRLKISFLNRILSLTNLNLHKDVWILSYRILDKTRGIYSFINNTNILILLNIFISRTQKERL